MYDNSSEKKGAGAGLPKLCGADCELGNFILGLENAGGTCREASRALLHEVRGHQSRYAAYTAQDVGRKYLASNGGCIYIDLDHLELCLPEVVSAHDFVACWHAMLRIARRALDAANRRLPKGQRVVALVNNSDGHGHSYGAHLNVLVTRKTWDDMFKYKLYPMLYLAAYQASSIVLTGQGKVGSENGRPRVAYQISQRADFMETLTGEQTTYRRTVVNSRDEALCGSWSYRQRRHDSHLEKARVHDIFFDNTLAPVSVLLKIGGLQIILAMIEAGRVNPALLLDDPVAAVIRYSHDPTLSARARLADGRKLTAVELACLFLEEAIPFVDAGHCEETVPRAREILALWEDTLNKLKAGDINALIPRLDWVLKQYILEAAMSRQPSLGWESPELKHLDHLYSSLDDDGLYWAFERAGAVEQVVGEEDIERFVHEPPEDTRAWTRAMLLRAAPPDAVEHVDWDAIRFRLEGKGSWWAMRSAELANPLAFTKREMAPLFQAAANLEEILDGLDARTAPADLEQMGGGRPDTGAESLPEGGTLFVPVAGGLWLPSFFQTGTDAEEV